MKGFSLIELIFTLLIIGVLIALSISTLGNSINKTAIVKLKSDLLLINNGINNYLQKQLFLNQTKELDSLEDNNKLLFSKILQNPMKNSSDKYSWLKTNSNIYIFNLGAESLEFTYDNQFFTFTCDKSNTLCKEVLE